MKHFFHFFTGCISLCILLLFVSCHKENNEFRPKNGTSVTSKDFTGLMVPSSRLALFYDADEYNLLPSKPASKSTESETALEDLLDKDKTLTKEFKGFLFQQIPFRQNDEEAFYASYSVGEMGTAESATRVKKFLVQSSGLSYEDEDIYVVTMITDKTYFDTHPDFDFFSRPNYTGIVVFSNLEGEFMNANVYRNGCILPAERVTDLDQIEADQIYYISLFGQTGTKGLGGTITASYCTGYYTPHWYDELNAAICYGEWSLPGGNTWGANSNHTGGSSGGNLTYNWLDFLPDIRPVELKYWVRVSTNCPEDIRLVLDDFQTQYLWDPNGSNTFNTDSLGTTIAQYLDGSYVSVYPEYVKEEHAVNIEDFHHWTGFFMDMKSDLVYFTVNCDIESTAYYGLNFPCTDKTKGVTNPLKNMSVAASGGWNYRGGTFGMTRSSGKQRHDGLDLYATPGTPIYALYTGKVISAYSSAPDSYSRGYGNELRILSANIYGQVFVVQYAHLNYGTPIATNRRTGQPYKVGDIVYQGDLIGYSGRTGNAFLKKDVPHPHLHLGIEIDGKWVDPKDYINGSVDASKVNKTKGKINNIKCD